MGYQTAGGQMNEMDSEHDHAGLARWWTGAETFHISAAQVVPGENGKFNWDTLAQSKNSFTTHCPIDRGFFERCHALGVRCFPYVIFLMGPTEVYFGETSTNPPSPIITSTTYEGVDFGSHPEFYELDQNNHQRPWPYPIPPGQLAQDGVGMTFPQPPSLVCPNVQAFQDKMVAWVDYIMGLGADGVFVDTIQKRQHCYATHPHIIPGDPNDKGAAQDKAFVLLLKRVREMVKQHRPDGLVLGNSGDPLNFAPGSLPEAQEYLDADMFEAYICGPGRTSHYSDNSIYPTWAEVGRLAQPYLAAGRQILVISIIDNRDPCTGNQDLAKDRADAFFCYANARLAGFVWFRGSLGRGADDLSLLRLGRPVTGELADPSGVLFRVFERGLVAVNWDSNDKTLTVCPPIPGTIFYDIYQPLSISYQFLDVSTTGGVLTIPAASGRVYLFGSDTDYGLNRLT
jgi:hypothetical protein